MCSKLFIFVSFSLIVMSIQHPTPMLGIFLEVLFQAKQSIPKEIIEHYPEETKAIGVQFYFWANEIKNQISGLDDTDAVKELRSAVDKVIKKIKDKKQDFQKYLENLSDGAMEVISNIKKLSSDEENPLQHFFTNLLQTADEKLIEIEKNCKQ